MDLTPLVAGVTAIALVFLFFVGRATRRRRGPAVATGAIDEGTSAAGSVGRIRQALAATGRRFRSQLDAALGRAGGGDSVFDEIEDVLLASDVGARTTGIIIERLRRQLGHERSPNAIRRALGDEVGRLLESARVVSPTTRPWVVLVTGINGVGKTTTIGKLAALHRAAGRKVLLVAADTFRAAAIDQLGVWAERTGSEVVRHTPGADPSAVAFDGVRAAVSRGVDVVLVDTAGRLHTRVPLMDELRKVRRTIERELPAAPHETLLVLDATTGQNALAQARTFLEVVGVTGVIVTKLDGTARGGVIVAIGEELGIPVRYVGVGEGVGDLREFDAEEFVSGLLGEGAGD